MTETTTNPAPAKPGSVLTNATCERRVSKRTKVFDRIARGLYVSITTAGVATFSYRFSDPATGKQRTVRLGVYHPETFKVTDARARVYALKALDPTALVDQLRQDRAAKGRHGMTVAQLVERRIAWMQQPDPRKGGRANVESWKNSASHLRRFVTARLGRKIASDVTRHDIATLTVDILEGKFGVPSVSNARHMRRAISGLFHWASRPEQDFVPETCRPTYNLSPLPKERSRERVLDEAEIKRLWIGLDDDSLTGTWDRKTRLAIKFALVTGLRSRELLGARRDELVDLDGAQPCLVVPVERVKRRRVIEQPLSPLAVAIIREAMQDGQEFVFESPVYPGQPIHRIAMATALRGTAHEKNPDKSKKLGLCALLGLPPFTPHDLRRTAAALAGDLGFSEAAIAKVLDHEITQEDGKRISRTTRVYSRSKRTPQKQAVLLGIAAEIERIIREPAVQAVEPEMRLAA